MNSPSVMSWVGVAYSELSDPSAGGLGIVPQPDHTHCPRLVKYHIHTVHLHRVAIESNVVT